MVLVCKGNILDLKKTHKLNCNRRNEIFNTLVIDNNKILKIKDQNIKFYTDNISNDSINKNLKKK